MFRVDVDNVVKPMIVSDYAPECKAVFTDEALQFVGILHELFEKRRLDLLEKRKVRNTRYANGETPGYKPETASIREGDWRVNPVPSQIHDRRVEITGPTDAKMMINALNSGAKVFMADLEDSTSPTWKNIANGQLNLYKAVRDELTFTNSAGKFYSVAESPAVLMVRPRGLHLEETNVQVEGKPISASLFDFGLFFYHNVHALWAKGSAPYFYLAKLEDSEEAEWWNEVFIEAQRIIGIPRGTIKATVLVETFPLVFQMHEVLYALREHSAGLNCGRWDYLFSMIKTLGHSPANLFPDRDQMTMTVECMTAYSRMLISTCHTRGAHAMGGMAAQIPIKNDVIANERALEKVKADKEREVRDGHDGSWVAHPALVPLAMEIFNEYMPQKNQIDLIPDWSYTAENLSTIPKGSITEEGVRKNISIGLHYLAAWLSGQGAAAIHHLMEDAATAEISRVQLWQWLHFKAELEGGMVLDETRFDLMFYEESAKLERVIIDPWKGKLPQAKVLFNRMVKRAELVPFLTSEAQPYLS